MSDLIERGREYATGMANPIVTELCDEIERLRAKLSETLNRHSDSVELRSRNDRLIEQVPDRGQMLLDGRRGQFPSLCLDPGSDVERLHGGDRRYLGIVDVPGQEVRDGAAIGAAGVRVVDLSGEEFEERGRWRTNSKKFIHIVVIHMMHGQLAQSSISSSRDTSGKNAESGTFRVALG